jgi:hypothetical protein
MLLNLVKMSIVTFIAYQYDSDLSGMVSVMSTHLANNNISMLNLTLFTTDLVLVRQDDLERSWACLKHIIVQYEQKWCDGSSMCTISTGFFFLQFLINVFIDFFFLQ